MDGSSKKHIAVIIQNHATGKYLSVTNEIDVSTVYQFKPEENLGEGHTLWKMI